MIRSLLVLLLVCGTCFGEVVTLPCGCPAECAEEKQGRCWPCPIAGVAASIRACPGLWVTGAVAAVIAGVVYALADKVDTAHS